MNHYASAAPSQRVGGSASSHFQRRPAICLVLTAVNGIIVVRFVGTLYRATTHNALQQVGVTLMFAALLGSLARMWFLTPKSQTR